MDEWGVLEVKRGVALLNMTFSGIVVPAPSETMARTVRGDG